MSHIAHRTSGFSLVMPLVKKKPSLAFHDMRCLHLLPLKQNAINVRTLGTLVNSRVVLHRGRTGRGRRPKSSSRVPRPRRRDILCESRSVPCVHFGKELQQQQRQRSRRPEQPDKRDKQHRLVKQNCIAGTRYTLYSGSTDESLVPISRYGKDGAPCGQTLHGNFSRYDS